MSEHILEAREARCWPGELGEGIDERKEVREIYLDQAWNKKVPASILVALLHRWFPRAPLGHIERAVMPYLDDEEHCDREVVHASFPRYGEEESPGVKKAKRRLAAMAPLVHVDLEAVAVRGEIPEDQWNLSMVDLGELCEEAPEACWRMSPDELKAFLLRVKRIEERYGDYGSIFGECGAFDFLDGDLRAELQSNADVS